MQLRRRRSISQPRVAELARLPWVFKREALNPAKGLTPCAQSCASDPAHGAIGPIGRVLGNPRDNRRPILKVAAVLAKGCDREAVDDRGVGCGKIAKRDVHDVIGFHYLSRNRPEVISFSVATGRLYT